MYIIVDVEMFRDKMGEVAMKVAEYGMPVSIVEKIENACPNCKCSAKKHVEKEEPPKSIVPQQTTTPVVPYNPPPVVVQPPPVVQSYRPPLPNFVIKEESADVIYEPMNEVPVVNNEMEYYGNEMEGRHAYEVPNNGYRLVHEGFDESSGSEPPVENYMSFGQGASTSPPTTSTSDPPAQVSKSRHPTARVFFTPAHVEILQNYYNRDSYASSKWEKMQEIAKIIGTSERRIIDWFKNRRKKEGVKKYTRVGYKNVPL